MSDNNAGYRGSTTGTTWRSGDTAQRPAYDPWQQPELFRGVLTKRVFAFIIDLVVLSIPIVLAIIFIALFGISVMDGIIVLSQYNQLIEAGLDRASAVLRTGELQMRPVLMTCVIAGVGLLPAALSSGIGSQVQKPLAVVVVSGIMLAPALILVTLPVLIALFSRRPARVERHAAVPKPAV